MNERASIVQVHLGKEIPPHVYPQLSQARLFNPDTPIYLITNTGAAFDESLINGLGVVIVRIESLKKSRNHKLFSLFNRTNRRSLGGFWLYASERFFALESFLTVCRIQNIVHLENDIMLYESINKILPAMLETCPHIGITMDSENRCVPGFVFIRDLDSLKTMNAFLLRGYLSRRQNDMEALARYMAGAEKGACSALPVIPPEYRGSFALESQNGGKGVSPWYDAFFHAFGGIFDAAAIGQYLGGIDKRLFSDSKPGFVNETAVYDPRNLGLFWKTEGGLRKPHGKVGDREFPIFNLHIHSKDMTEFMSALSQDN